ncbi:DNA-binding protein [Duganella sp. FT27W]|uniref:DNA-binding protein n=1 Tax=Duganella sp. FT27W TaxID=2654636 RepID=UPI00128C19A0|nr:DNA-binding protein [Duganella sp. FT27W]MPQ56292.1 DNA-binding protein [Duganella sp. FT27W]
MTAPTPKKRNLTPKQWAEAEALWTSGEVTYEDLVKKYGKSISTFERHFRAKGLSKGATAAAVKKKVEETLAANTIDEATVIAARIKETKEQHYSWATNLAKLTWNEILEAKRAGNPLSVATNNLKALESAANVMKKMREERWAVLGLDRPDAVDPSELPELLIAELTAEQIQELRDRDHSEIDDLTAPPPADDDDADDEDGDDAVVEEGV